MVAADRFHMNDNSLETDKGNIMGAESHERVLVHERVIVDNGGGGGYAQKNSNDKCMIVDDSRMCEEIRKKREQWELRRVSQLQSIDKLRNELCALSEPVAASTHKEVDMTDCSMFGITASTREEAILTDRNHLLPNSKHLDVNAPELQDVDLSNTTAGSESNDAVTPPENEPEYIWGAHKIPNMNPLGGTAARDLTPVTHEKAIIRNTSIGKPESDSADIVKENLSMAQLQANCSPEPNSVYKATYSKLDDMYNNMVLLSHNCNNILTGIDKLSCLQMDNLSRVLDLVQQRTQDANVPDPAFMQEHAPAACPNENEESYPGVMRAEPETVMILPVQHRSVQDGRCFPKNSKTVQFSPRSSRHKNTKCGMSCSPKGTAMSRKSPKGRSPRRTARSITRLMTRRTPRNAAASRHKNVIKQSSPKFDAPCWPVLRSWRP